MDLTWLGYAATRMRTRTAAVVMDPYDKSVGGTMGRPDAHIVTISHDDTMRNGVSGVAPADGDPMVLVGPGEYEIRGVHVEGVRGWLAGDGEAAKRASTLWLFEAEQMRVAHLGGLGSTLIPAQLDVLSRADIVIVPIALADTLPADEAAKAVRAMEPSIVIPVGYEASDEAPLKAFVRALGGTPEEPVGRFTINSRSFDGEKRRIVLLEARA